ncbi:MAG: flagellar M-ring protein FliF [Ruminiclostridium sp.]|nr:flagellar M-ring protein FliF [Ruminiclostridium sp.]
MDKFKEAFGKFRETVKTKWTDMGKKGHIVFFSVLGVVVISAVIAIILATRTEYAVLYTGTSAEERAEVLSIVSNDLGATEVTVGENGDILVPKDEVEQLRMQLSMQGYPKSTFNYNIWDDGIDMFSTESDKRIKQIQQLQENLRATLGMISGVDSAIAILNVPDADEYVIGSMNKKETSASIVLQLEKELSNETIKGIYNLVRTAVPDIEEENITVTDGAGNLLSYEDMPVLNEVDNDEEIDLYYKRLDVQNSITAILKDKLEEIFDGIFSDFRVGVDVQLNYDSEVKQSTEYTPSVDEEGNRGGMVSDENYVSAGGGNAAEGGLVGTTVDADISPDYPTLEVGEGDEFYYEWQKQINYLVNEEITQVEKEGYSYDNISATVVVDATGLSQAEIEEWQGVIANAIGADFSRVTFKAYPFMLDRTQGTGGASGDGGTVVVQGERSLLIFAIIALGVILVILLIIALVTSGSSKKRAKARREGAMAATLTPGLAPSDYPDGQEEAQRRIYDDAMADLDIRSLTEPGEETREDLLKKEIREFSKANPEIVAQLIRTWMRSDE